MNSLRLLQLVSPALPVGAFSYSEGLEVLAHSEKILTESELTTWLEGELLRGQLRIEAAALSPMMDCLKNWKEEQSTKSKMIVYQWNSWLLALRDSIEIRSQQLQMGKSLLQLLSDLNYPLPNKKKDLAWPIAWSWAGLSWSISKTEVLQAYLYGWVANQLSAALRLLPLGPNKIQTIQFKLVPLIESQSKLLLNKDPYTIWTGDVGATMAQQTHAELYSKLFRS